MRKGPNIYSRIGFTLVELLVVISIIALLSSVVVASLNSARAKARDARRIADMRQIQTALEFFYDSYGRYPRPNLLGSWENYWNQFTACLETGVGCWIALGDNSNIAGYVPVLSKVPRDPLSTRTYYIGRPVDPAGCTGYRLGAYLETNNAALQTGLGGSLEFDDNYCKSATYPTMYCIGVGSCAGW